jgi:hypothetical protein
MKISESKPWILCNLCLRLVAPPHNIAFSPQQPSVPHHKKKILSIASIFFSFSNLLEFKKEKRCIYIFEHAIKSDIKMMMISFFFQTRRFFTFLLFFIRVAVRNKDNKPVYYLTIESLRKKRKN